MGWWERRGRGGGGVVGEMGGGERGVGEGVGYWVGIGGGRLEGKPQ